MRLLKSLRLSQLIKHYKFIIYHFELLVTRLIYNQKKIFLLFIFIITTYKLVCLLFSKMNSSSASVVIASSNPHDAKMEKYEQRIVQHEAEIVRIKAHERYDMLDDKFILLIKSEKDGIHDCETAIHDLRAQQQQSNGK